MFPFTSKLELSNGFTVDQRDVHERIGPTLTPERLAKIKKTVAFRNFDAAVVLENVYDRGNTSAVMRTAEGFGFVNFHCIEPGEKYKEGNRTSAGAVKWVEAKKWKSTADCVKQLRAEGKKIYATHLDATAVPIEQVDFSVPCALVLGNEHWGCSPEMLDAADQRVILPMVGFVQSFNISVAGALALFSMYQSNQRHGRVSSLNEEERAILEAVYMLRTQDSAEDVLKRLHDRKELSHG